MAGPHELPARPGVGDQRVPWQIPQHFTDAQILEHLRGVPRPYSTELRFTHPDLLNISDAVLVRLTGEDLIFEFKEMRRIGKHSLGMRVGRLKDQFIIASHYGDISQRFSNPVQTGGEYTTGRFNMSTLPEAESDIFIGESYRLSDPRFVDHSRTLVVAMESSRRIRAVRHLPEYVQDYDAYLADLARERRPRSH